MTSNIIAVAALILSAITFVIAQVAALASRRRARMPVLVFVYDDSGVDSGRWLLRNVGNGPALNIDMAIKLSHEGGSWEQPTRIPPIGRGGEFVLTWLDDLSVPVLSASYEDFLHKGSYRKSSEYTVQSHHDLNEVVPKRDLPRWSVEQTTPAWQRRLAFKSARLRQQNAAAALAQSNPQDPNIAL
jgi:hypothetical protein